MINQPKKPNTSAIISLNQPETIRQFEKIPDSEIWAAFNKGDELAFNYIYRRNVGAMFNYGNQLVPKEDLVKDCIQNLFIEIRKKRGMLSEVVNIKAYLFKILQREIFKALKNEGHASLSDKEPTVNSFLIELSHETKLIEMESEHEITQALIEAMNQLTARQRQAILLLYYEGLSYKEISEILELNEVKSARKLVYRAIATLKSLIKKN